MRYRWHKLLLVIAVSILSSRLPVTAVVRLPALISDGMVLQREAVVKIWGWAGNGEKVKVDFIDSAYVTHADIAGKWEIRLSSLKPGGPYTMTISGDNTIVIRDVLIGDVWVCSGQSNMELNMKRVSPLYEADIAAAKNDFIRCFTVPKRYNYQHAENNYPSGVWIAADPVSILDFSAAAYFFARELYERFHIPVGLINASLGGSPVEAWISEDAIKAFPGYYGELLRFKDSSLIASIETRDRAMMRDWYTRCGMKDEGYREPGEKWTDPDFNANSWPVMNIPGYWADVKGRTINGVFWFRKQVDVPAEMAGKKAKLLLGRIVDADSVFVNGAFVGTTSYQYPPRRYEIQAGILKAGINTIVVRVINNAGRGGFVPDKPYEISAGTQKIDLKGSWSYHLGAEMEPMPPQTFVQRKPSGLYNAMIAPMLDYSIKGVIWYQGESNADKAAEYRELFTALIRSWRKEWQQGNFPFLFVQLPNFMEAKDTPSESNWALLREAQLKTLSEPNTGMAVTIDIGEWNDIHPLNKKDVGKRLALAAFKVAYGDEHIVYSGPLYHSMKIAGSKIILSFTNNGSGLVARNGNLRGFAIAGTGSHFVWANARISHNRVIVWNDQVRDPKMVRYAWADNPEGANLYNREGLPASPFRTDK